MDKKNTSSKRPSKGFHNPSSLELIPLGLKSKESESSGSRSVLSGKRELPISTSLLTKKVKLSAASSSRPESPNVAKYDDRAIDCPSKDLFDKVMAESGDTDVADRLLCGAIKLIRLHRAKPDQQICLTLLYLAKIRPSLFTSDLVTGSLCSLLKRDLSLNFKTKGNPTVTVLACNLLYAAYVDEDHWSHTFIEIFLEDSLGERVWVDRRDCKPFVDNIMTAFGTNVTPKYSTLLETMPVSLQTGTGSSSSPSHSPYTSMIESDTSDPSVLNVKNAAAIVSERYEFQHDSIEQLVLDTINDAMNRRQHVDMSNKQLLRLLASVSGYSAVRLMVLPKLELWLSNPKLMRPAQDLLMCVCLNCSGQDMSDKDVITGLLKLRLKNKQLVTHYLACLRELLDQDEENLRIAMTHTIYNELSTATRNPNNMAMMSVMFQHDGEKAPRMLADIFLDLLMNKEDYLRNLRMLLREIIRTLRHDFTFHSFCLGLMEDRSSHPMFMALDALLKERLLLAIADLVTVCEFLTISPAVREAASAVSWGDKRKDISLMQNFWSQIAHIQKDAVIWMHETVVNMFPQIGNQDFIQCLYKVLMMAQAEHYYKIDNWPPEQERQLVLRLVSETPVLEDTVMRLLMMGLEADYPLKASDALDVSDLMVNRAAALSSDNYAVLAMKNLDIIKLLLAISTYHHPDNIRLPRGYKPPHLAIASMYWKSWSVFLIICVFNPSTFGKHAWQEYPTLRLLMEMVMTNNYTYPPVTALNERDNYQAKERQISELEKQEILEFEGHLAAATSNVTITEQNSLLLSQLIGMDAAGHARSPPGKVIEDIKILNDTLHLGHMLCRSRNPDFLMDIINKQGTTKSMPWLSELVESSEGSLDVLPVQCLCEFLLFGVEDQKEKSTGIKSKALQKLSRQERLIQRLRNVIRSSKIADARNAAEVIEYFFKRLSAPESQTRQLAIKALKLILADNKAKPMETDGSSLDNTFHWLLMVLPSLEIFSSVELYVQESLHKALYAEMSDTAVKAYIQYLLSSRLYTEEPSATILAISSVLTRRQTLADRLLTDKELTDCITIAYSKFTQDAIKRDEAYEWADKKQKVMIQWESGQSAIVDIMTIYAIVVLLCKEDARESKDGKYLLNCWFPSVLPTGYLESTSQEAQLFTDTLKVSMLQTGHEQMINAALTDLSIKQLLTFVQLFGIPVKCMQKLFDQLDDSCEKDPKGSKRAIQSRKHYLRGLMVTQRLRGIIPGPHVIKLVGEDVSKSEPMDAQPSTSVQERLQRKSRTLSTMERKAVVELDSDIAAFVRKMLSSEEVSKEGWHVIQRIMLQKKERREEITSTLNKCLLTERSSMLKSFHNSHGTSAAVLRLIAMGDVTETVKQLFSALFAILSDLPSSCASVVRNFSERIEPKLAAVDTVEECFNKRIVKLVLKNQQRDAIKICADTAKSVQDGLCNDLPMGLLIDWLELLDPEIDSLCTDVQDKLLFGASQDWLTAGPPYLRALHAHQARWSSLRNTISRLLNRRDVSKWSATAVLDFVSVCQSHPRLFQGREQKEAKRQTDNVLGLTAEQVYSVADLICTELSAEPKLGNDELVSTEIQRVDVLIRCCVDDSVLKSVTRYIEARASRTVDSAAYGKLLVLIYKSKPKIIHWLSDESLLFHDITLALSGFCALDKEAHAAITALGAVRSGRKSAHSLGDANLSCRRLASEHPLLFLRHTSMLSSLLSGRSQFTYGEFTHRNYLLLHVHLLSLIELLQPHIFLLDQFSSIIDIYFSVFKIHGAEQDETMGAVFVKFVSILCNYLNSLPDACVKALGRNKDTMSLLQNDARYNKNPNLKTLSTASYMPHKQEALSDNSIKSSHLLPLPHDAMPFTNEQLAPTIRKLGKHSPPEEVLAILTDLDNTSKKRVDVLVKFVDQLKKLMGSLNADIRDNAFKLAKRYTCHNPKVAKEFLSTLISCVQSDIVEISSTAISYVTDFALLMCEDDRKNLLDAAFTVIARNNSEDGMKNIKEIMRIEIVKLTDKCVLLKTESQFVNVRLSNQLEQLNLNLSDNI